MKRQVFRVAGAGGYVDVYPRGEVPILDLNFFEGNRSLAEAVALRDALDAAIKYAKKAESTDIPRVLARHGAKL